MYLRKQRSSIDHIPAFQINCFDIIGENDVQTEGTLRARFETAASCAPCILTLRHIDALARTTQALDTGKGQPLTLSVHHSIELNLECLRFCRAIYW